MKKYRLILDYCNEQINIDNLKRDARILLFLPFLLWNFEVFPSIKLWYRAEIISIILLLIAYGIPYFVNFGYCLIVDMFGHTKTAQMAELHKELTSLGWVKSPQLRVVYFHSSYGTLFVYPYNNLVEYSPNGVRAKFQFKDFPSTNEILKRVIRYQTSE